MADEQPTPGGADPAAEQVEVRDDPARHRFDILVDGAQAGYSLYTHPAENPDQQRIFYHTVIDDAFGGRGLAGTLTSAALEASIADGYRIVPVCPYVVRWLGKHPGLEGSVDRVTPTHLEVVRRANDGADGG